MPIHGEKKPKWTESKEREREGGSKEERKEGMKKGVI